MRENDLYHERIPHEEIRLPENLKRIIKFHQDLPF